MRPISWIRSMLRPAAIRPIRLQKTQGNFRPDMDLLEDRLTPSGNLPSIDGTGNNLDNPSWGSAGSELLRVAPANYGDGISTPAGAGLPSARHISNVLADQPANTATNDRDMSAFIYAWGQFIDHDLDLTLSATPKESFNIPVPKGDPYFDPTGTGTATISLSRANFDADTGTSTSNPRQQKTDITAWLDGSMVYGSSAATAESLRTLVDGKLKTSDSDKGPLLPVDETSGMFIAGDIRANENPELTAIQTLFVREHNRIADQLKEANPDWTDEDLYQQARLRVIAELQAITYNEFLPALLGPAAPGPYKGYDPSVNPSIANEFSTAAYRIGHTLVGDDIEFLDNDGNEVAEAMELKDAFFNPAVVKTNGIDSMLKYLASDNANEVDTKVVSGLRNFLFGAPGQGGLDLAALNIQRGRDHGLSDYNTTRAAYGLPRVRRFADITSNPMLQKRLQSLYGSVDKIDLWVGGLAEDHLPGSSVGQTFARIISDQFARLRDGDRFWHQNVFAGEELEQLSQTSLADVIRRNSTIDNLQQNVFFFKTSISGQVVPPPPAEAPSGTQSPPPSGTQSPPPRGTQSPPPSGTQSPPPSVPQNGATPAPKLGGITVNLLDADGSVVATTKTKADGSYFFGDVELGTYNVQVVLANNQKLPATASIQVTKGGNVKAPTVTLPKADSGTTESPTTPPAPKSPLAPPLPPPLPAPMAPKAPTAAPKAPPKK